MPTVSDVADRLDAIDSDDGEAVSGRDLALTNLAHLVKLNATADAAPSESTVENARALTLADVVLAMCVSADEYGVDLGDAIDRRLSMLEAQADGDVEEAARLRVGDERFEELMERGNAVPDTDQSERMFR
jgi:hypothetical protein